MAFGHGVALVAVVLFSVWAGFKMKTRTALPEHVWNNPAIFENNVLSEEAAEYLLDLARSVEQLPSNQNDVLSYKALREHIGEARPIGADGRCDHPFLVPNIDKTLCVLPGRIDIGRHHILTGGVEGLKDSYQTSVNRLQSFGLYLFNLTEYPVMERLFESPFFQDVAKRVCPKDKQLLDPFQFNLIAQVPGQTVPTHVDGVYFWGASRFQFPQWLLAAMAMSGLFQKQFIDQVQVVGYFHSWNDTVGDRAGQFVYWNGFNKMPKVAYPYRLAASAVDGSKTVHAAIVYRPQDSPPVLDKSKRNALKHVGEDKWVVTSDDEVLRSYVTDDIRFSVVYRARCFASEEERARYHAMKDEDMMTLESILTTMATELVARGKLSSVEEGLNMDRLDFSMMLLDEFVRYPLPPLATIPYNYCALDKLYPFLHYPLSFICN